MSSWSWSPYTSFYPSTGFNMQITAQGAGLYTGNVYAVGNNLMDTMVNAAWYPGQTMDVYVQAVCGQDTSAYVGPITMMMPLGNDHACGAHEIIVCAPGLLYNNTGATVAIDELGIVPPVTGAQSTTGWANNNLNHQAIPSNLDTSGTLAGQYNYDYVVTSTICPNDTSNVIVIVDGSCDYTAIVEELNGQWNVYPNPAVNNLTVENNTGLMLNSIEILDMNSKVIRTVKVNSSIYNQIELNELQTGMYFLKMKLEGQKLTKQFVKH